MIVWFVTVLAAIVAVACAALVGDTTRLLLLTLALVLILILKPLARRHS